MAPSTDKPTPELFTATALSDMPSCYDITPELIDHYVRQGKAMRAQMAWTAATTGGTALRRLMTRLAHRIANGHRPLGTTR